MRPSTFLIIDPLLGLLKIQETQDLDAGDYTCVAINDAGRATGKITLDVGCKHLDLIDTFVLKLYSISFKQFGRIICQNG